MINDKKYFLIMIIVLILITMGGVWASENHTADNIVTAENEDISVEISAADDTQLKDASYEKENITVENNDESAVISKVDSKSEEVLGAPSQRDVLGADSLPSSITSSQTWDRDYQIRVQYSTYYTTSISSTKNIIIDGGGHTVSGLNQKTIFQVSSGSTVTFKNINFINGKTTGNGGAIDIGSSSVVSFINCNFTENKIEFSASYGQYKNYGGAIYFNKNCRADFKDCNFNNNYINVNNLQLISGKNHIFVGSAINIEESNGVKFTNCNFTGNYISAKAYNTQKPSVHMYGCVGFAKSSNVNFDSCNFKDNEHKALDNYVNMQANGGAIYFSQVDGLNITNCNFTHNSAPGYDGGAIMFHQNCTYVNIINSNFINNSAGFGGAIMFYFNIENNIIENCTFIHNTATGRGGSGEGGAIDYYGNVINLTISSKFINNIASKGGSALSFDRLKTPTTYKNFNFIGCEFINHTSFNSTISILSKVDVLTVSNTLFKNCSSTAEDKVGSTIYLPDVGKAIFTNSNFTDCTNNGNGGVLNLPGGANVRYSFDNCRFENNNATKSGGAVFIQSGVKHVNFTNCNFTNNHALTYYGGAVFVGGTDLNSRTTSGSYIKIDKCNFTYNTANHATANADWKENGIGGAICFVGSGDHLTISNSNFDYNEATSGASIQFFAMNGDGYTDIDVNECNFTHNKESHIDSWGGSAITFNRANDINVTSCRFENNTAKDSGALFFDICSNVRIYKSNFTLNNASNGAGVYFNYVTKSSDILIDGCNFTLNTATGSASAVDINVNSANIINSVFDKNSGNEHGAVYFVTETDNSKIFNCNFTNNRAVNNYVIYIEANGAEKFLIDKCIFDNNTAGNEYVVYLSSKKCVVKNSDFINNTAKTYSALSCLYDVDLSYCNFSNNTASDGIGALYLEGPWSKVYCCNFNSNTAKSAGGIYAADDNITITNCNFTGNNATSGNGGAMIFACTNGNITYCNFNNNTAKVNGGAVHTTISSNSPSNIKITSSNFTGNDAGSGGAIYFTSKSGTISNCIFKNNTATNGGAVVLANSGQTIKNSTFIGNNATTGGAVYALSEDNLNIKDSTFDQNTASNGGAIHYDGTAGDSPNGLVLWNDTFTKNTAIYNGGAVHYLVNASAHYRDYNLFNNEGTNTSGRLTWSHSGKELIHTSLFEGNIDYYMSVSNTMSGLTATITVTVPKRAEKGSTIINITLINAATGRINYTFTFTSSDFIEGENWLPETNGDNVVIKLNLGSLEAGTYNATVGFKDSKHDYKEEKTRFRAEDVEVGDFTRIQKLINTKIKNALDNNLPVAVIDLNESYYNCHDTLDNGSIIINSTIPVIINGIPDESGARPQIDAKNYCRIFDIYANNVTINNIIFTNGNVSGSKSSPDDNSLGGAILWIGSNGTITNSTFHNNWAIDGGAVFVQSTGQNDKIINSEFRNNTAVRNGGAVDWNASSGNITNSVFKNNNAEYGGAVFVGANGTATHIYKSTFNDNNASQRGGAVDWYSSYGDIIESNFTNNHAQYGGAVFVGSKTEGGKILNSTFKKNTADFKGGAVDWNATGGHVEYSVFEQNHADYGGAIFVGSNSTKGVIYNSTFTKNTADVNGGAIDWNASEGKVNKSFFYDNSAGGSGGAIFVGANGTDSHILYSVFEANNATNGRGGAVDWYASSGDIEYSNFTNNYAQFGGAVFVGHKTDGGNITNSRFINNTASIKGGAVDWNATSGSLRHSYFEGNEADFGGALFVGSHSQHGSAFNNTYIANHAKTYGGAIDLNTTGGMINGSRFYNNTADKNGGAVYVGANGTSSHIVNSVFEGNNATNGRGGAVDWFASSGEVYNSNFTNNYAKFGGAIFVGSNSGAGNVTLSNFINNTADVNGGAIVWNASNGKVKDSTFQGNSALNGGAIFVGSGAGEGHILNSTFTSNNATLGGAVYLNNIVDAEVNNSTFTSNTANQGGALYIKQCSDFIVNDTKFSLNNASAEGGAIVVDNSTGNIANSSFATNKAVNGGAVYINSDNVNVTLSTFTTNTAESKGGDICVDESEDVLLYNLTLNNSKAVNGASIYTNSDLTVNKTKINNWESPDENTSAILLDSGNSTIAETVLSGNNAIIISEGAEAHLIKNNNTAGDVAIYAVLNKGTLYLSKNKFTSVIINMPTGHIKTNTTTRIINNDTLIIKLGEDAILNSSIVDDNNNSIIVPALKFTANNIECSNSTQKGKYQYGNYIKPAKGVYLISVNENELGLDANQLKTGVLKVKDANAKIELNVTQDKDGEIVSIKATISPDGVSGNVTFIIDGQKYTYFLNTTKDLGNDFTAVLDLYNITPDTYKLTAIYNGDDTHFGCGAEQYFIVDQRKSNITVTAADVLEGQTAIAYVTTGAYNGTVTLMVNGRQKEVKIENGKGNWTIGDDLPVGNYTITAFYKENTYYKSSFASDNFTVYKYEIKIDVEGAEFDKNATITITLPEDINGLINVTVDEKPYLNVVVENGTAHIITDKLSGGNHTVNVTYPGNDKYPAKNATKNFTVATVDDYQINIDVDAKPYGENTTITITVPTGITQVNVTIDNGKTELININSTTNKGQITVNNLTATTHNVVASFSGNQNYSAKTNSTTFEITKATPNMAVIVNPTLTGPGTNVNVTVVLGKNATGMVILKVNDNYYVAEIKNGNATYTIKNVNPGNYSVTAQYSGDTNYYAGNNNTPVNFTVTKYNTPVNCTVEIDPQTNNVTIVVNVNKTAEGTITINGINENIVNGETRINLGILAPGDYNNTEVIYSGSTKFNENKTKINITVPKIKEYDITVTVNETKYGENTTIIIKLPEGANGTVFVNVDGKWYNTSDITDDGIAIITTDVLPAGKHVANVTYINDTVYANKDKNGTNFTVKPTDDYNIDVNVTAGKYGEDVVINITAPVGITQVNVTIDGGKPFTVNLTDGFGSKNVSGLSAGYHDIVVSYAGDENYTAKEVPDNFTIAQATPVLVVDVPAVSQPNSNVTITVNVGDNATGYVNIKIGDEEHLVKVVDGVANYTIKNAQPGDYSVTAEYLGDKNYTAANTINPKEFKVSKYNTTVICTPEINPDTNNVTIHVKVNNTATGNVTVNGVTVKLVDGEARVNLGVLPPKEYKDIPVSYNGDDNFNINVTTTEFVVNHIENYDIGVTVNETKYGENTTIIIKLPGGANGTVFVNVDGKWYNTSDISDDGIAIITTDVLPAGKHVANVTYINDTVYANKDKNGTNFTVKPTDDYNIDVNVTAGKYGEDVVINITAPVGITQVNVTIDGGEAFTVNLTDGFGSKNVSGLAAGYHDIVVSYSGDENYTAKEVPDNFTIAQATPVLVVDVPAVSQPNSNVTITVNVGDNATGYVNIKIGDEEHLVKVVDGVANYTIKNAQPGDYSVTAEYLGDKNYTAANTINPKEFKVSKYNTTVICTPEIDPDTNNVTILVKVNNTATGNVTVNGVTVKLVDGEARVNLGVLPPKEYKDIQVSYNGDDNFNINATTTEFVVNHIENYDIGVTVNETKYGENTTIIIKLPEGANGTVFVKVGNKTYNTSDITDDGIAVITTDVLPEGKHEVNVTYINDTVYANKDKNGTKFTIKATDDYNIDVNVTAGKYGEDVVINITAPVGITQVNVTIDGGKPFTVNLTDGFGSKNVSGLAAGYHDIVVSYAGDDKYDAKEVPDDFTIAQATPTITIDVPAVSQPNSDVTITVNVGDNATGYVNIKIGDEEHLAKVVDGVANYTIKNAQPGNYSVTAQYLGDKNYTAANTTNPKEFKVSKYNTTVICTPEIDPDTNNVTIHVKVNNTATGNVTVNGVTVKLVDGEARVNLGVLAPKEYKDIPVSYNGDDNFNVNVTTTEFVVNHIENYDIGVTVNETKFGENTTIIIKLPEGANGTVFVKVGNKTYNTSDITDDGIAIITTDVLPEGIHEVNVTYINDTVYANKDKNGTKFTIKATDDYTIDVNVTAGKYGEDVVINITAPVGITQVNVTIDGGEAFTVNLADGFGSKNVSGLAAGHHDIVVSYAGDDKYDAKEVPDDFTIAQATPVLVFDVPAVSQPNSNVTITVNVGDNATGYVNIKIGDEEHLVKVVDGVANYTIKNAQPGNYSVTAEYLGDKNYTAANTTNPKEFKVSKYNTTVICTPEIDPDTNNVTILVKVNSTATGNVTVNGVTVKLVDGEARVNLGVLPPKEYKDIPVSYNGDDNFNINVTTTEFVVNHIENYDIGVTVNETKFGENTTIIIKLPEGANGTVFVKVGNKTYNTSDITDDGIAVITTDVLPEGKHEVNVTYINDTVYANKDKNGTNFTIKATDDYNIDVNVTAGKYGEDVVINITAPVGITQVNVTIDGGDAFTVNLTDGFGSKNVSDLAAGYHDIVVSYAGDDKYDAKEVPDNFTIDQTTPTITIDVPAVSQPNSNVTITVNVGDNATGYVNIKIGDEEHLVKVVDGVANYTIKNAQPGNYSVTAEYLGDKNYTSAETAEAAKFTVDKYNTTVICTPEIDPDTNNVTIHVKVNSTSTGNVTVNGVTVKLVDGEASVNLGVLPPKEYKNIPVSYNGDDNFNINVTTTEFVVNHIENYDIGVTVNETKYGENTTIIIKLPEGANGTVFVKVGNKTYNTSDISDDGIAIITTDVLPAGEHEVNVTYTDDSVYADKDKNGTEFTVKSAGDYTIDVNVTAGKYGEDTIVNITAPCEITQVNVSVDGGKPFTVNLTDGVGSTVLNNLSAGIHDIVVSYAGDENYTAKEVPDRFNINQTTPEIKIIADDNVDAGSDVVINVEIDEKATGFVNINVDGVDHLVQIKDGKANYTEKAVNPGKHNITVTYMGDKNYTSSSKDDTFTAGVFETHMEVIGTETDDDNNVTVIVKVDDDATGNVTIAVGNKTYNATVENGTAHVNIGILPKGTTEINVTYGGDDNYGPAREITSITVPGLKGYVLPITAEDVDYGSPAVVVVQLPEGANKTHVRFHVDGNLVDNFTINGNVATLTVSGLDADNHTVRVVYEEDEFYATGENSTTFEVRSANPSINVEVKPIDVGEDAIVNVTLPDDAQGSIIVDVNGTKYVADVVNGSAIVSIPNLGNGTHELNITYTGDDNYNPTSTAKNATVSKITPEITANTTDITLGENAIINVTVPADATGTVTIKIGEIEKTQAVTGGANSIIIPGVGVGTHEVEVTYNGNDKYTPQTTQTTLKVNPEKTKENDIKVEDLGNGTVIVTVPEGATGKVNLTLGNETYEANITDGVAVFDIANKTNATPGRHDITVTYSGDENHTAAETNGTATVPKWDSNITATIPTIRQGDVAQITVEVAPSDATGNVTVTIDGVTYTGTLDGGKAIVKVPGLTNGTHEVKITYSGDDKYNPDTTDGIITVEKAITAKVNGTGNNSQVIIELPENGTTQVTVKIDNKTVNHTIGENNTVIANLTGLTPGEHNLTVIYTDKNGTQSVVNTKINVPRWSSSVNASAKTIREGDDAKIIVKVGSSDMTGRILVDIDGTGYYADITSGEVTITAPGLKAGVYDANVTYEGNDKYDPSNNTFKVTVESPIVINVNGTGNNSQVVIDLPENSSGNVTVKIDNKDVPVDVNNNTAIANLTGFEPGEHNITVIYTDNDGTQSIVNTTINVPCWSSSVNASAKTIREGDDAKIIVKVGSNEMTGIVHVDIDGTGYYANVTSGEVTITAPGIKSGTYDANVTFLGNSKYGPSNNTFKLIVEAPITINTEGAGNSTKVIVSIPENGTDDVTVLVDGNKVNTTIKDGQVTADLNNIAAGEHNVTVIYVDKDGTQSVVNQTIKIYNSIKANDMTRGWNSPYDYEAEFLDKEGHVLANTQVTFKVNGKTYNVKTDNKGIAKLTASQLNIGKYDVEIINDVTGEKITKTTTIVKRLIENKDVTLDFYDGSRYSVKAIGDDGKPVGAGEVVGFRVNNVEYNGITNSKGIAILVIKLNPKKYKLTAQYAKYKVSNKIHVKQTLKLVKKSIKIKKGKKLILKAKLKWTNGKAIKGKKIVFKFKGKKYNAKTNKKGIATITLKKKITKKLKPGKNYRYSASYHTNKVNGKIKVKK